MLLLLFEFQVAAKKILRATEEKKRMQQDREVAYLRRLNHPYIIEFYGTVVDCQDDELIILTEYASGGSLDRYLENARLQNRKLPRDQVYEWAIQAAKAIRYLQEMKVAHRDIKAANSVITEDNVLKLCDFGLAQGLSDIVSVDGFKGMCSSVFNCLTPELEAPLPNYGTKTITTVTTFPRSIRSVHANIPPEAESSVKMRFSKDIECLTHI